MITMEVTGECHTIGVIQEDDDLELVGLNRISMTCGDRQFHIIGLTKAEIMALPNLLHKQVNIDIAVEVKA